MYQLMFAIITPALIVGAIAERMKFSAIMAVHHAVDVRRLLPARAHGVGRRRLDERRLERQGRQIKAIDFAGGTVVHMSSGWSALVLCLILGKRKGWGQRAFLPHSLTLTMVGTGMLWVGWYGFNAGSAVAADGVAANAFMTTTLATAIACCVWPLLEWITRGKPTILGFCSGAVAGLVVITPATGFVNATGAIIIGVLAGVVPFLACTKLKAIFQYDDALDTFGVHAVGGTLGALMTGFLATRGRQREPQDQPRGAGAQRPVARAAQGDRRDAGAGGCRHHRHRDDRQGRHRPAADHRERGSRPRRVRPW